MSLIYRQQSEPPSTQGSVGNEAPKVGVDGSFLGEIPGQLASVVLNETGGNFQSRQHFGGQGRREEWEIFFFFFLGVGLKTFLMSKNQAPTNQTGFLDPSYK